MNFLDYLAYIPLFLSMHDNMCVNPLDMRSTKYEDRPASVQRDMNPLGYPLSKVNLFDQTKKVKVTSKDMQQQAKNILAGRADQDAAKEEGVDLYNKYKKYVHLLRFYRLMLIVCLNFNLVIFLLQLYKNIYNYCYYYFTCRRVICLNRSMVRSCSDDKHWLVYTDSWPHIAIPAA